MAALCLNNGVALVELFTEPMITLSVLTVVSLLVNAVTIYRWVTDYKNREKLNDQAFHMIRGLALSHVRRGTMVVRRIRALEQEQKLNSEAMVFLENIYSDSKSSVETLLATAKALKPREAQQLPFDGDALLQQSMLESAQLQLREQEIRAKLNNPDPSRLPGEA